MARFQEDEEEDKPVERPRRRPKKKPVSDDDDDAGGPPGRGGGGGDDEEEEGNSLSTGNVFLDIVLDFRDDCIDWAREHVGAAVAIVVVTLLLMIVTVGLTVRYVIKRLNRPTLELALTAYDLGSYGEARRYAEEVLKYAAPDATQIRAGANFVLGASTCAIAEIAWDSNRQPYYLAAAAYLRASEEYGFLPERQAEGFFLLGKSLYLSGELVTCREPLLEALERKYPEEKNITWFLTNSWFLDVQPDFNESLRWLSRFRKAPNVTEEERYEADLLQSLILLRIGDIPAAERAFLRVPIFQRFETMRHFVSGQIAFLKARGYRQKAAELENRRDPLSLGEIPVAPPPVAPLEPTEKPVNLPPKPETESPDPFQNPETEKLLPSQPEGSVWPVVPVTPEDYGPLQRKDPWSVIAPPVPVPEGAESTESPIYKRLAALRGRSNPGYAQEVVSAAGVPAKSGDPDAVIVLQPGELPQAPQPEELPTSAASKPAPVNPVQEAAKRFHQSANAYYEEAISHFREVRRRETFVPRWTREATLLEGISHEETGNFDRAQEIWLSLVDAYPLSPEAAAAGFLWAELERKFGRTETSLRGYEKAFAAIRENPNYACPWVTKEEILDRCREMIREAIVLKEYRQALTMLHLLQGVMPEGEAARLRGETYEDWAGELRRRADVTVGVQGDELLKESNEKYRRSAEAYMELTRAEYDSPDFNTWLWRIAENYRYGRDYRRAIPAYRNFLRNNYNDHRPEVYLYLGEMYIHLDGIDEAVDVLETAIEEYPNHALIPRIRYVLSRAYYEQKNPDKAREMLQLNLIGEYAPASSIYRDSLYALAKLHFERKTWDEAIGCYESALKLHPNAIQAADAHYHLARSFLRRSEEMKQSSEQAPLESVRDKIRRESLTEQEKALHHIQKAEELLIRRQEAIGLTPAEKLMLRNTLFAAGTILMRLNLYEQAVPTLNIAATRYQDQPEAMDALLNLAVAFRKLGNRPEALATLNRAEIVLRQLEKSGTIPADSNWASQIEVQKNLVNMDEIHE